MGSFWNKTKVFFESRGWRIFWSLFVIAVFVNLFVQTLHRPMDWFRVVLLITLPILVIRRVFEIVQAIKHISHRHQYPDLPCLRNRQMEGPQREVAHTGGDPHRDVYRRRQHRRTPGDEPLPAQNAETKVHPWYPRHPHCPSRPGLLPLPAIAHPLQKAFFSKSTGDKCSVKVFPH